MQCRSVRDVPKVRVLFIRVLSVAGPLMGSRPNAGAKKPQPYTTARAQLLYIVPGPSGMIDYWTC